MSAMLCGYGRLLSKSQIGDILPMVHELDRIAQHGATEAQLKQAVNQQPVEVKE